MSGQIRVTMGAVDYGRRRTGYPGQIRVAGVERYMYELGSLQPGWPYASVIRCGTKSLYSPEKAVN